MRSSRSRTRRLISRICERVRGGGSVTVDVSSWLAGAFRVFVPDMPTTMPSSIRVSQIRDRPNAMALSRAARDTISPSAGTQRDANAARCASAPAPVGPRYDSISGNSRDPRNTVAISTRCGVRRYTIRYFPETTSRKSGRCRSGTIRPESGNSRSRSTAATSRRTVRSAQAGESISMNVRISWRSATDRGDQRSAVTSQGAA